MKQISIIVIFWTLGLLAFSQSNGRITKMESFYQGDEIVVSAGVGTYLMTDLKAMQIELINSSDVGLQLTTTFPAYFQYSIRYGIPYNNAYNGFIAGLMSTGARSSLADYSGYMYSDINCQAFYAGYYYQKEVYNMQFRNRQIAFGFNLNFSFISSNIHMTDKLNLYDNSENDDFVQTDEINFNAVGLYTDPSLFARLMLSKSIGIELNAGGAISLSSPIYYKSISNAVTIFDQKRFVNWSGLRVSAGIVCKL